MTRRTILTDRQRAALFDLPTEEGLLLRHYMLADDDLATINERRRPANRIVFALQLCALRFPGRVSRIRRPLARSRRNPSGPHCA